MKYNFNEGEYVYYDSVSFVYESNILGLLSDSEVKEYELYLKLKEKYG